MMWKFRVRSRLARGATIVLAAVAVVPMLITVGAGTSSAACTSFRFNGTTTFVFQGGSATFTSQSDQVGPSMTLNTTGVFVGNSSGGVVGGRGIAIDATFPTENNALILFRGNVNDDGTASGTATITGDGQVFDLPWNSSGAPLVCSDAPKAINVTWQEFIGGIRATVSMTNNTGQVGCTYSTQGLENFDRRFTLFDSAPTDVTISPAVPLFRVWPVTITCDNGVRLETERFY